MSASPIAARRSSAIRPQEPGQDTILTGNPGLKVINVPGRPELSNTGQLVSASECRKRSFVPVLLLLRA